jgi:quercetin dioxygenase-like cupin family protein
MSTHNLFGILATGALLSGLLSASAATADPPVAAKSPAQPLMRRDLPDMPGKEVIMLTVTSPPGGVSAPHRHNAEVFVYMLEGSITMQVDGQAPVTLTPGQTFHEGPTDIHRQAANTSKTEPAKFLVFIIKDKGKPVTVPVPDLHH